MYVISYVSAFPKTVVIIEHVVHDVLGQPSKKVSNPNIFCIPYRVKKVMESPTAQKWEST